MVRKYIKKTDRQSYDELQIEEALKRVQQGESITGIAKEFSVPRSTLSKRYHKLPSKDKNLVVKSTSTPLENPTVCNKTGFKPVFTAEQETALVEIILDMEASMVGLTQMDIRKLAFGFAERLKINHPFSVKIGAAGKDWAKSFMDRHNLTLRKAEHTSVERAKGFNRENVSEFFKLLSKVYEEKKFDQSNIYNVDETGITIVAKAPTRVVYKKGKKQVGGLKSAERGETVTATICMSASGSYMPPLLIFPRKKENPALLADKPPGAWAVFDPSGWMKDYIFLKWLKLFVEFSRASSTNPVLLILDGHTTHVKNLDVITEAKNNNVTILCLPPHCSNKLQPLDVGFMKPLSTFYTEVINNYQRKGLRATLKDVFRLFGIAYMRACKQETAVNSFQKCGIYPFNPNVFSESDYAASTRLESNFALTCDKSVPDKSSATVLQDEIESSHTVSNGESIVSAENMALEPITATAPVNNNQQVVVYQKGQAVLNGELLPSVENISKASKAPVDNSQHVVEFKKGPAVLKKDSKSSAVNILKEPTFHKNTS